MRREEPGICLADIATNPKCWRQNRGFFNKIDVKRYLAEQDETAIGRRLERHFEAVTAIEAGGLGCAQAQQLALEIQTELGGYNSFIVYLASEPRRH